ncbi:MAG: acyl-CoA synthetase [Alphaproteobacteria bacterium]
MKTRSRNPKKRKTRAAKPRAACAYDVGLERNEANYQPLTPLSFLRRVAEVHPEAVAIVHGGSRTTYSDFYLRSLRLASALARRGIRKNDTVSALLPNTPAMLVAHHGIPMAGAVLHAINTRLDATSIAFMLDHAESKALIVDLEFADLAREALAQSKRKPLLIACNDPEFPQAGKLRGAVDYEEFLSGGDPAFAWKLPGDEWDAITLNYTSGTTGNPKGVVYHHRGAALMGYANILAVNMGPRPVYLWTLPMFHCNGWCFPWTLSLVVGTHVCLRQVRARAIYELIAREKVTHLCGAPIVMAALLNAAPDERRPLPGKVEFVTAAAPPPEAVLAGMAEAGFNVTHVYGLTEVYGPAVVNDWKPAWDSLPSPQRAARKARQGVAYHALEALSVLDPETMKPVPADGETLGEVMFRGNIVMKGYLKNPKATREAFRGGWFHSGDLGVRHPDNFIQLKDRSKDIIISGGENISSIEVEDVLHKHPGVMFAAVVARPDEKWGETPCAFVERKPGYNVTEEELLAFCRENLARFKCPKTIVLCELPKTSTGKIQKFRLREMAKTL